MGQNDTDTDKLCQTLGWCSISTSRIWVDKKGHPALEGKRARDIVFSHELCHFYHLNGTPFGYALSALSRLVASKLSECTRRLREIGGRELVLPLTQWLASDPDQRFADVLSPALQVSQNVGTQLTCLLGGEVTSADEIRTGYAGVPPCIEITREPDPRWYGRKFALGAVHVFEGFAALAELMFAWGLKEAGEISGERYDGLARHMEEHVPARYRVAGAVLNTFLPPEAIPTSFAICDLALQGFWQGHQDSANYVRIHHPGWRLISAAQASSEVGELPWSAIADTTGKEYRSYVDRVSGRAFPDLPTPGQAARLAIEEIPTTSGSAWDRLYRNISHFRIQHPSALAFPWLFSRELLRVAPPWRVNDETITLSPEDPIVVDVIMDHIARQLLFCRQIVCADILVMHCHQAEDCPRMWSATATPPEGCLLSRYLDQLFGFPFEGLKTTG